MAERRMFAKTVIDSDAFLDMPLSAQALYFHLSMRADDDGFINNPKKIQRMIGCNDDDLKLLIAKSFVIPFESGIVVIKHWKLHNYIRADRYKKTVYQDEKAMLIEKENKVYSLGVPPGIPNNNQLDTQVRLGKDRLGKDRLFLGENEEEPPNNKHQNIINKWNQLGLAKIKSINSNRSKMVQARIREYSLDDVIKAIESIKSSSFLKGQNKNNWIITFDWFIKPNNFVKVLEGNYVDKEGKAIGSSGEGNGKPKNSKFWGKIPGYGLPLPEVPGHGTDNKNTERAGSGDALRMPETENNGEAGKDILPF